MDTDRSVVDAPDWFLRNCVRSPPEINRLAAKISLRGTPGRKEDAAKASPSSAESRKAKDSTSGKGASTRYEVEPCIYNEFLGLIAAKEKEGDDVSFTDDAILVRLPDSDYPGCDFLVSMAAKFASDIEADLIVLDYDDLHDLAEYFYMRQNSKPPEANAPFLEAFLKPLPKNKPKKPRKKPKSVSGSNPPIDSTPASASDQGSNSNSDSDSDSDLSLGSDSDSDSGADSDSDAKSTSESILSLDSTSKPRKPISEPPPRPPPAYTTRYLLNSRNDKMASIYSGQAFRYSREAGVSRHVLPSLPQLVSSTVSGFMTIPWFFVWLSGLRRGRIQLDEPKPPSKPPPVRDPIKENAATFFRSVLSSPHARAVLDEKDKKEKEKETASTVDKPKENGVAESEAKQNGATESEVKQNGAASEIEQDGVNGGVAEKNGPEEDKTEEVKTKKKEAKENGVKVNGVQTNGVQDDEEKGKEVVENEAKVNGVKEEHEVKVNGVKEEHEVKVNGVKEDHEEKLEEKRNKEENGYSAVKDDKFEKDKDGDKNEKAPTDQPKPRSHFNFQNPKADNVRPIIIVIPQLEKFGRLTNFAFRGLKALKSSSPHLKKRLLTITTTSRSDKPPSSAGRRPINPFPDTPPQPEPPRVSMFSVRHFGIRPNLYELLVFPARSPAQITAFAHDKDQISQRHSIRVLQREVRRHEDYRGMPHLQPYAEWNIPDSDSNPIAKYLRGGKLLALDESIKVGMTLTKTKKAAKLPDILGVLMQVSEGSDALSKWNERDAKGGSSADLPPRVVRVIKRVTEEAERSCSEFNAELEIMKTLVHPSELSQGWSEIEVEPAIKSRVQRMISLLNRRAELTGILKKSAMGGVILYGPPGTGKTHLARVIAKETSSVMLRVSAAEIERTWAGEAEKVIQALFKLAREIYPCIVFIDEADSIFGRRRDSDKNWERKITNQLLGEFGGFENDISSPLLLLATNFPNDLDPAVLRRAPNRLYMGLPSTPSRQNIFKICLREEKMDKSVDLEELAEKTSGYTGSDIEYICQQAAMAALEDFESSGSEDNDAGGICLKMTHFSQTLTGASPSVSGPSMTGIESFAREYDRSAVDMIKRTTDEFGGFSSYLYI